jgi:hypothetical protein
MFIVGSHCTSERLAMFIAWFQLPFEDLQLKLYEGFNLWPSDLEIMPVCQVRAVQHC